MNQGSIPPYYPFPWRIGFALLKDALLGRSRTFRADALGSLRVLEKLGFVRAGTYFHPRWKLEQLFLHLVPPRSS